MNVTEILSNTLSPDQRIREDAVKQLETAAREHWPQYMGLLSAEIANESSPAHVRQSAALALKNQLTAKEQTRRDEYQAKWIALDPETKVSIKKNAVATLAAADHQTSSQAANFIASIAAIEIPRNDWPELMPALVEGVQNGPKSLKLGSYKAIEYICETVEPEHLSQNSNAILNAVVQGTQASQRDDDIRIAAISTLYSGLSFVRDNMEREGERNFIMQVVCESTQHTNPRVQVPAYSCLVRIMQLYYEKMKFYMEKALFGLTVIGMRNPNLDVATQAVEFWSSVCEEELDITAEIQDALELGEQPERENYNFAKTALMEVLPQILQLLFRQDEDDDDEWTVSNSAAAAITLFAQIAENAVLGPVLQFVEANIRGENWNQREAAVMAFGSVMDGPEPSTLQPLVAQAFPVLIGMLADPNSAVRESTSWALARATELIPKGFQPDTHLRPLMEGLVVTLRDTRSTTIQNCAWTIQNICGIIGATRPTDPTTPLGPYYEALVTELMNVTTRTDSDLQGGRNACWEAICKLTEGSGLDTITSVQNLTKIALDRLENSITMRKQAVGMDDRLIAEEQQVQLCAVLNSCLRRIGVEARPVADRMMTICIQLLQQQHPAENPAYEDILYAIGTLAGFLDTYFHVYVTTLMPFIYAALEAQDQPQLLSAALGVLSDVIRAVGEQIAPHCDQIVRYLFADVESNNVSRMVKPAILAVFGEIALAIGAAFEGYLPVVMQLLQQAATLGSGTRDQSGFEMLDYIDSLNEGILEAYSGIILGLKGAGKASALAPYMQSLFGFLATLHSDPDKSEDTLKSMVGIIGDVAEAFTGGELREFFQQEWITECLKQARSRSGYRTSTKETARWAREMVRAQLN